MRVLAISSQTAFAPVGNAAAVPALQAECHEAVAVPTVILSHHPGLGRPAALRVSAPQLGAMLGNLDDLGVLDGCAAVMTGYFAANDQVHCVARIIRRIRERNPELFVMIDPVIGDDGALYVPLPVAEAVRDDLLPLATCVTPNRFELEWMSGIAVEDVTTASAAAGRLAASEVVATSIPDGSTNIASIAVTAREVSVESRLQLQGVPHGTGDLLSGAYLARRMSGRPPSEALAGAMAVLDRAITLSLGAMALNVAGALCK
jgi:pyridoxine kinase